MEPKVKVNGKEYPFVTEADLTLGEAAEIERITGQGYDLTKIGALGLLALTYVSVKRHDAFVKVEDLQMLKAEDISVELEDDADAVPPPSSGGSDGSETPGSDGSSAGLDVSPAATPDVSGTPV